MDKHLSDPHPTPSHDTLPSVGEDDNLDDEVSACLVGLAGHKQGGDEDSFSSSSLYSTGTVRDTDTDTTSYYSVDTLRGSEGEVDKGDEKELQKVPELISENNIENNNPDDLIKPITDDPNLSYSRPSYLAGSTESEHTGSRSSLVSEGEVSFAGQVNDRLGRLLGYVGGAGMAEVEDALANIMGYEIVIKEKEKFTVYKIRISCPSSVVGTWFVHRRYSDFLQLRKTLIKENPPIASQLSFPPKRWVGSNLEPVFLGRRLAGLQVFLASALEIKNLKSNPAFLSFLCLDKLPLASNGLEANRVICDTLEVAVQELREQLRKRENLELELDFQKNMNDEKDQEIQNLSKENQLLRQQKDSLGNLLSSGRKSNSSKNLADLRQERPKSMIGTLEEFTAKFSLKSGESPLASSSPSKSSHGDTEPGARRRIFSQGEETEGDGSSHENVQL